MSEETFTFKRYPILEAYAQAIVHCMNEVEKEDPEAFKKMTPEERLDAGANWASKHILITEQTT